MAELGSTDARSQAQTLHVLVDHDRNRELLTEWLDSNYEVVSDETTLDGDSDLCLVDERGFANHRERLREWKQASRPVFAPVLLLSDEPPSESFDPDAWQTIDGLHIVDDIVSVPIEQAVLQRRLSNLLERRQLSQELDGQYRESKARFTSLFHATPDPALVISDDGSISFVNDAFCSITGCERDSLVSTSLEEIDVLPTETVELMREAAIDTVAGERYDPAEVQYERVDGSERWAELNASALTVDDVRGAVLVLRDVTERRRRARELAESERRFSEIAEHVNEVIWMAVPDASELLYMSPGVEALIGKRPAEIRTAPAVAFLRQTHEDDADALEAWFTEALADVAAGAENAPYQTEFRLHSPDGLRWVELDAYPVFGENDEVERLVGLLDDITDKKEREAELQSQNDRLEEFTSIVSHDLRNPLQVIQARADLIDGEGENVTAIKHAADRMDDLIGDLLALAKQDEQLQDVQMVSLDSLVSEAWTLVETSEATFENSVSRSIEADPTQLQQLVENLLRNAVEHGGEDVRIRVGDLDDGFYLEDDGPGIPPDERDRVFEMGVSTDPDGTGFGLSIVQEVADAHDWTVSVTDSDTGGARFEITGVEFGTFSR
jgi:PAS domain S-box-containing protein